MFVFRFLIVIVLCLSTQTLRANSGQWADEFQYGPFVFRTEFPLQRDGQLVRELYQLRADMEQMLQLKTGAKPIEIFLFRNRQSYVRHIAARVPEGINRRALYAQTDGVGRLYAYYSPQLLVDLRHECTHALIHNSLDFIPLWLDEGLAEYFEIDRNVRVRPTRMNQLAYKNRFTWRPSFKRLEGLRKMGDMNGTDYLNSWAWVHFLLHESPQSRAVLVDYLAKIKESEPPGPMSKHIAAKIPNSESRLRQHFSKWGRQARR